MHDRVSPPFQPGQSIELEVTDIAFGGEGVARVEDFVVFVPFVIPGERVKARVKEVKKSFARADLEEVLKPSHWRREAECAYFGECGGCQYQHIAYERQLEIKHQQVSEIFKRIGNMGEATIAPVVPCPREFGYRNRIMVRSHWNGREKRLEIGFVRHDNNWVVPVEECKIAEKEISDQIPDIHRNPPPKGGIKVVLRKRPENWVVPGDSFFQNNFFMLPSLIGSVAERLSDNGSRFLIDAFCGVGFFALELASRVESFVGVEFDRPAIKAARENMANRGISNGDFVAGATQDLLGSLLKRFPANDSTVVLDPPRKGCFPQAIEALRRARPSQIIYVSCHPATLARDLKLLCADDVYQLRHVTPLDMFPQTAHVECVADLRLVSADGPDS